MSVIDRCPVCGLLYRGSLADHLDRPVDRIKPGDSPRWDVVMDPLAARLGYSITRCDWNLNTSRIWRQCERQRLAGWVKAGSVAARVAKILEPTGLGRYLADGTVHSPPRVELIGPLADIRVWWLPDWALPIATAKGLGLQTRAQVVLEAETDRALADQLDATGRIGGPNAVAAMIPPRCGWTSAVLESCCRALDHAGRHVGASTGRVYDS